MVKYYGRARQRIGSVNTNQLGLKMSGCPSKVGRNPVNVRYIQQRVSCMRGVCGIPQVHSVDWHYGMNNAHPFCAQPSGKCLAAAGGIGNIYAPYFKTVQPGKKGCTNEGQLGLYPPNLNVKYANLQADHFPWGAQAVDNGDGTHTITHGEYRFTTGTNAVDEYGNGKIYVDGKAFKGMNTWLRLTIPSHKETYLWGLYTKYDKKYHILLAPTGKNTKYGYEYACKNLTGKQKKDMETFFGLCNNTPCKTIPTGFIFVPKGKKCGYIKS